jgi:hypothetical protein
MNKKTLIILLLIAVVGFVGFFYLRSSMFSKEILKIEILGQSNTKSGDEIEYTIQYKNNGNFVLEKAKLNFELPENSLTEDGKTLITKNLDDIYPGDQESITFKARLLGKEGDLKTVKAAISYVPKNITATYESDTSFITKIESTPITLEFDMPTKAEKGKTFQYSINYFSNIDYPLENLSIKIEPTNGFEFVSSDPSSLDNSEWKLATLKKTEGGRINITGKISADVNQDLNFKASLGIWKNGSFVVIKEAEMTAKVIQPLLYISQLINGSSSYVASPGEVLRYQIFFRNIGSSASEKLYMVARLDGAALDLSTLQPESGGQVQSSGDMIVWDYNQTSQLKNLDVQEQEEIDFTVKVKSDWNPSSTSEANTTINDEVNISQTTQKFSIKVSSGLVVSQSGYYKNYEISNSGPVPPQVGKTTTYTIKWEIKNYYSDVKNVKVKATLPKNINLTGQIMPQNESSNFTFDSVSREIVWSVGDIQAGTGVNGDPYSLSFQILFTPDSSQKGAAAPIIGKAEISGENQFTDTKVSSQDSGIDTSLPDDFANSGGGIIQ